VVEDTKKGLEWLMKAAEQGHVEAQHMLAVAYPLELIRRRDGFFETHALQVGL
jgi:TPR repeat protein